MLLVSLSLVLLAPVRQVSFAEARSAAVRAPDVQIETRRAEIVRSRVTRAHTFANPTLMLTTAKESARLGAGLTVPVQIFGQRGAAVRAAKSDAKAALLGIGVTRAEARWNTTIAWIDVWEAQERARLLAASAADAAQLHAIAVLQFDAGGGARLDVVRTNAVRARARADADAARLAIAAATARLAPWIGAPLRGDLRVSGAPGFPDDLPPLEVLEQRASGHPALAHDRAAIRAAELHIAAERRQIWPSIDLSLTVNMFDPTFTGAPDVILGVAFAIPIFDQRSGPIERAEGQRSLAQLIEKTDAQRFRSALIDAYRRSQSARAKLRALREDVLPAMAEARAMTNEGYRAGRIDLLHVLDAQRSIVESQVDEMTSIAAFARAAADLERALGVDLAQGKTHAH